MRRGSKGAGREPAAAGRHATADERGPVRTLHAESLTPVVLTCEHASRLLPPGVAPAGGAERAVLSSHWGWDIGAWDLTQRLARRFGAGAVGGGLSRLIIDLNRPVTDPTLIRREAGGLPLSWNARVTPTEIERRMLSVHVPYHAAIDRLLIRRLARGVRPLLFAIHTFTPVYEGCRRDFDAGVLFSRSRREAILLAQGLQHAGLRVRYNEPYSGLAGMMYSIHRHATHHGLPCLELEVNQALFDRRGTTGRGAGAGQRAAGQRIAATIARALGPLIATAAARPGRQAAYFTA